MTAINMLGQATFDLANQTLSNLKIYSGPAAEYQAMTFAQFNFLGNKVNRGRVSGGQASFTGALLENDAQCLGAMPIR